MRTLYLILNSFFATFFCFSQTVRPFPMEESSLLWKIEGPEVASESYLFGTIHLIDEDKFYFPKKLMKIIQKSDQVALEIILDASTDKQSELIKHLTLKEGSLFDYFTPEQTDSLLAWAEKELQLAPEQFRLVMNKMKPFVVVQMATQMGIKGKTASYELNIETLAREKEIELLELETIGMQIGFFDQLDSLQQTEMVMDIIRNQDENDQTTQLMHENYLSQDIDALYTLIATTSGMTDEIQTLLVTNRNKNWIAPIRQFIAEDDTFIAVGAGHLGGPNGLIRLLEKEGYTLIPIKL